MCTFGIGAAEKSYNTGREKGPVDGFDNTTNVAFSPDGAKLAAAKLNHPARIWDAATGNEICRFLSPPLLRVEAMAFSPDGKMLAYSGRSARVGKDDANIYLASTSSGKVMRVLQGHKKKINNLKFTQDGKKLVSTSADGTTRLWNVGTGKTALLLQGSTIINAKTGQLLTVSRSDTSIQLRDAVSRKIVCTIRLKKLPASLERYGANLTPLFVGFTDARTVVFRRAGKVHFFDVQTGKEKRTLALHRYRLWSVKLSPDGKWLAYVPGRGHVVYFHQITSGKKQKPLPAPERRTYFLAFSSGLPNTSPTQTWMERFACGKLEPASYCANYHHLGRWFFPAMDAHSFPPMGPAEQVRFTFGIGAQVRNGNRL